MHRSESQGGKTAHLTVAMFLGAMLSLALVLLVLLIGAAAVSGGVLKEDVSSRGTVLACVIGCLFGGLFTCRKWQERRLLAGAGTGAVCFLLILGIGLLMGDGVDLGSQALAELAACICGGAVAGFLCKKKKKGKRTARRAK